MPGGVEVRRRAEALDEGHVAGVGAGAHAQSVDIALSRRSFPSSVRSERRGSCGVGPRGAQAWLGASGVSRVAGGGTQPCARRVGRTPGTRAGGIERRLARTTAFEHAKALDDGSDRVAVALRGQRERLGGSRAAMPARPSKAGHQVEGAAVGISLHQRPDGRGAANRRVDRSSVPHRSYPGFVSSRMGVTRSALPGAPRARIRPIAEMPAPPRF